MQAPQAEAPARFDERTFLTHRILAIHDQYDIVFVTREIFPPYILWYSQNFDPGLAGKFSSSMFISEVGNIHFIDSNCPSLEKDVPYTIHSLIVDKAECQPNPKFKLIETIKNANLTAAYRLVIYDPVASTSAKMKR